MKNFKEYPICSFISVLIITIFSLYATNAIKTIPCEKDMTSIFVSQFIHTDFFHLASNLYGIYSLSKVENKYGPKKFFSLIIFLLVFNTIAEGVLHRIINTPCSIGFSGILYGVLTFELVCDKFDYLLFGSIVTNIFIGKVFKSNVSLQGHLIGAISGIVGGLLFKNFFKCI
jgi:membrane associated rhomboid family serine protease